MWATLTNQVEHQVLTPISRLTLEEEIILIRVALASQFSLDPFSPCTRVLRLMEVLSESQLDDASHFATASGTPVTMFVNPLCSIDPEDSPLFQAVVEALTVARNLDPVAWANSLGEASELHRFLVQTQLDGHPDLILGYVIGVGNYSPTPGGTYNAPPTTFQLSQPPMLVQAVEARMLEDTGLNSHLSPASVADNVISDGEAEYIVMNGTNSDVTGSAEGSPPWDLGNWAEHENRVLDFAGPGWDQAPAAMEFNHVPMAE